MYSLKIIVCAVVFLILFLALPMGLEAASSDRQNETAPKQTAWFATVDGHRIDVRELAQVLRQKIRERYYHGTIPEGEAEKFIREVAGQLIDNHLLLLEAQRRGLEPDPDEVAARIAEVERRNRQNGAWLKNRDETIPLLRQKFGRESILRQLESEVRNIPRPDTKAVQDYYNRHRDKFTRPDQVRASVILLKVDPSASDVIWQKTWEKAQTIKLQLQQGAVFSELAREFSSDNSARHGGDMGYQHRGMLGDDAQRVLDEMKPDTISEPVVLLDGIALFKLTDRLPAQIIPFDKARASAEKLLMGELADLAWQRLLFELRQGADIAINEKYYLPATWGLEQTSIKLNQAE